MEMKNLTVIALMLSVLLHFGAPPASAQYSQNDLVDDVRKHNSDSHFVFVHGFGHGAWCWYKVTSVLRKAGFTATALDMISDGRDKTNADTVTNIAQYTKPLIDFLADVSGQVILVGHSLAGTAISYAMEQYPEKISKAVFVTSFMPVDNQTASENMSPHILSSLIQEFALSFNFANGPDAPPTSMSGNISNIGHFFYNESPDEDIVLASTLLNDEPASTFVHRLTLTPDRYGSIRRFYVVTGRDRVIPPQEQENIINNNPPERVFRMETSDHSPFFSRTAEFSEILREISNVDDCSLSLTPTGLKPCKQETV